ncbi:transcriptional regulator [Arthrobacter sp. N199823]|uniref:transcriptional regulator n=1 Tax=Arthrobacter sp. N199823 TaxID=2058895 RepID=UPI000CE3D1A6|nr:transcriptional regulator [Arthrobacter sp. N199823]
MSHARFELDALIHSPVRFSIMGYLRSVDECEFNILRDAVDLSDSSLSQNLTRLAEAGFVTIEKRQSGRKVRTWIASTEDGDQALESNLVILRDIAGAALEKHSRP